MQKLKRGVGLLLSVVLIVGLFFSSSLALAEESEAVEITLLHDTHFHGNFGSPSKANIAKYVGLINSIRAEKDHSLFLGNGDELAPSLLSSVFYGEHMIDAFNASGLDVTTFGNHEFDYGPENLAALVEKSQFQWVSANVIDTRTDDVFAKEQGAERFVIKEVEGVKLGITGLGPTDMAAVTSLGEYVKEVPAVEAMQKIVPEMKEAGADVIIVLSHLSNWDAEKVATEVDGIDFILGDHNAKVLEEPQVINDTVLSFVGDEFKYVGEIKIKVENKKIVDWSFMLHEVSADQAPDEAVQEVVDAYQQQLDEELNVEIGTRSVNFDTRRTSVRSQETAIGNIIADSVRQWANADVAIQNGGGIRSDKVYAANQTITKKEINEILPFQNYVVKLEVTGEILWKALEHGLARANQFGGQFSHVSGVEIEYNVLKPVGERLVNVKVNGDPLDKSKSYTLATNDFLARGGDGYEMLSDAKVLITKDEGPLLSTLVIETIQEVGTVTTDVEGRINLNIFNDITTHPARADIEKLAFAGVINGVTVEQFDPDRALRRSELAVVIQRALNLEGEAVSSFSDVAPGVWFTEAVALAISEGLLEEVSDGEFKPNQQATRLDFVSTLTRILRDAELVHEFSTEEQTEALARFTLSAEISEGTKAKLAVLIHTGLFSENDVTALQDRLTRADMATLLQSTIEYANEQKGQEHSH